MYFLKVYNSARTTQLAKFRRYISLDFQILLNKPYSGNTRVSVDDFEANLETFSKYNRVSIYKGEIEKFRGYISDIRSEDTNVTIVLSSMMAFLKRRHITKTYPDQSVITTFEDIIDVMNAAYATEFTYGGTDLMSPTSEEFDFENTQVYEALQSVVKSQSAELYVDEDDKIWILSQVGEDKSDESLPTSVVFKYLEKKMVETNIEKPNYTEEGMDLANYVIGKNTESPAKTSIKSDVPVGKDQLEKVVTFPDITSQDALDQATQDYLDKHKDPRKNPLIIPLKDRMSESLYSIGDLCKIRLEYGFVDIDENYRVVRKNYNVTNSGQEAKMTVELGSNSLTREDFFERIANMDKRISDLQK